MTRARPSSLRLAADPQDADLPGIRPSVRVRTVAAALDMDQRDVRQLITDGELEAHGKGKRGVRVYTDSVAAWQARNARPGKGRATAAPAPALRPAPQDASYRESLAYLAKNGIA